MCIRDRVLRLLSKDELNLSDIGIGVNGDGETKTALFCVIPDLSLIHILEVATELADRVIAQLGNKELKKAAVTVAEGVREYSTGKSCLLYTSRCV